MQIFDLENEALRIYTLLGGFIVTYGLVSLILKERLYLSDPLVATSLGLIAGPACLNLIDPTKWGREASRERGKTDVVTEELTRIVLAIQVMAAAVNLPRAYIRHHAKSMFIMLLPVMCWMWISSAVIFWLILPSMEFVEAMLIAACITPTDPILANSVVQGSFAEKHIPTEIRYLLSAESGANDGMGFPFLFFALYLLQSPEEPILAISKWLYFVWGYQIFFSIIIGCIVGWVARKALRMAESRNWIDKESFLSFSFALAIFVVGGVGILGSNALLACFVTGTVFSWDDWFRRETRDAHLQDVIDMLLNLATFIYLGAILPWSEFHEISFQNLIHISILILIFRRLPIVVGLMKFIPAIHTLKEALFAGYFGPIGVGAIFLAVSVENELEKTLKEHHNDNIESTKNRIFPIVAFIVFSSIIFHGITVPILNIGSRIDLERLPSIASISNQVARLPSIDFESLALERDAYGRIQKREKLKAQIRHPHRREPGADEDEDEEQDLDVKLELEEDEFYVEAEKSQTSIDIDQVQSMSGSNNEREALTPNIEGGSGSNYGAIDASHPHRQSFP